MIMSKMANSLKYKIKLKNSNRTAIFIGNKFTIILTKICDFNNIYSLVRIIRINNKMNSFFVF